MKCWRSLVSKSDTVVLSEPPPQVGGDVVGMIDAADTAHVSIRPHQTQSIAEALPVAPCQIRSRRQQEAPYQAGMLLLQALQRGSQRGRRSLPTGNSEQSEAGASRERKQRLSTAEIHVGGTIARPWTRHHLRCLL